MSRYYKRRLNYFINKFVEQAREPFIKVISVTSLIVFGWFTLVLLFA